MHVDGVASSYQIGSLAPENVPNPATPAESGGDRTDLVSVRVHAPSLKETGQGRADARVEQARKAEEIFKKVNERINELVQSFQRHLHFEVHDKTGIMFVRVTDAKEGKVLRELPMKEVLDTLARIQEVVGLFMDDKA